MKLFNRLWKSAPTCTHNNSTAVRSEIGHDAGRRYYWTCSKCGAKVYIEDRKGNAEVLVREHQVERSLDSRRQTQSDIDDRRNSTARDSVRLPLPE